MTQASNRRRSDKLIKPGETLPHYDRAVLRCKQRWDTDSGRDIRDLTINRFQRATKTLSPGPLSFPSMKQEREKTKETLTTSKLDFKVVPLEVGMGGGGISTGTSTSPKLVAVDTRGYETTSQVPTG